MLSLFSASSDFDNILKRCFRKFPSNLLFAGISSIDVAKISAFPLFWQHSSCASLLGLLRLSSWPPASLLLAFCSRLLALLSVVLCYLLLTPSPPVYPCCSLLPYSCNLPTRLPSAIEPISRLWRSPVPLFCRLRFFFCPTWNGSFSRVHQLSPSAFFNHVGSQTILAHKQHRPANNISLQLSRLIIRMQKLVEISTNFSF